MANRLFSPDEQYCDQTGLPYAGGTLSFYASGTSTPLNTYSNQALSIANTNPVVLDSAGRAGSIFLQNLAYKVVLADSSANQIWTEDPVYSSDFSTVGQFQTNVGNPNGAVAGTAGSGTVPSSVIWDSANNILYVATTTGNTATTVWTAVNAATATGFVGPPGGYLTPTSGTPIIPSDVTSATALIYTPYVSNTVPIYNGTSFTTTTFSELTLTLVAAHTANQIYDVYVFNNSGAVTLASGPAWQTATAGSGARGAAAAVTRLNGIWVNNIQIAGRNGSTTYTIGANLATYLGSMSIDATNGQISFYRSWGQSRRWAAWNAYNRAPIIMSAGDSTGTWTPNPSSYRPANNATANSISSFCGLPEEIADVVYIQEMDSNTTNQNIIILNAIGWNSTTAASGTRGIYRLQSNDAGHTTTTDATGVARYQGAPAIGLQTITALEQNAGTTTGIMTGTEASMRLNVSYRG